jgi:hypothetical protein
MGVCEECHNLLQKNRVKGKPAQVGFRRRIDEDADCISEMAIE